MNGNLRIWLFLPLLFASATLRAQTTASKDEARMLTVEGMVEVFPVKGASWAPAQTNQVLHVGDGLRTAARSRATVRLSDLTVLRINELTTMQLRAPEQPGKPSVLDVKSGSTYFLGRERPTRLEFRTPLTSGAIRGTEFNLTVADNGRTAVALVEGQVALSNPLGQIEMASGEQGIVEPGKAPAKTAMLDAINIIQWCLYYPGILDITELELSGSERQPLAASLEAYSQGDLLQAVALYPSGRSVGSDAERIYRAATLLSAGQVEQAGELLAPFQTDRKESDRSAKLAAALHQLIAVVKNQPVPRLASPSLATEWLANSYYLQSQARLAEALQAARASVAQSPDFGFGWARVAELELSFGRSSKAKSALERSLELSPRNAQSFTVKGFILLTEHRTSEAQAAFEQAIALDGALGNAWLGRGLCRIQQGESDAGRRDLQTAAVLEPQRAILRSYLGKAFSNAGDNQRARKELGLAERLDPNDPTAWLYSALVKQEGNEVNGAVRDLEQSEKLNNNRRLFRSQLLLDEDQAVRSANLASIYQDAGMLVWNKDVALSDWSVREASRAVNYDYGNFSAHKFLANSYDALRDPRQINLRYETPWFSELLMANLLAPAGAANLSEFSSEQAYSRLFEQKHFGASSDTEYLSHGDWLERASQYGNLGPVSYAVDAEYRSERGWRANNDLEQLTVSVKGKAQLTPQDSVLIQGLYYDSTFGDTAQYYNQYGVANLGGATPSTTFRGSEREEPNLFLGYDHEWMPGVHTLFLAGHLDDRLKYTDPQHPIPVVLHSGFTGTDYNLFLNPFPTRFDRQFEAYTVELQQIFQTERQTFVAGARYQDGWNTTSARVNILNDTNSFPPDIITSTQKFETDLSRYTIYAYETVKPFDQLQITAGISYDRLNYPLNIDTPPISRKEKDIDQISPKAGLIWAVTPDTHLRGAYTRSLGGVFYENSVRLEPSQIAGFNQAFRSIVPESVGGQVPGSRFTTYGAGLEQSFKSNTYLSIDGEILESDATRTIGVVTNGSGFPTPDSPGNTRQTQEFSEKSLVISLSQLISDQWSFGARYQLSHADLATRFVDITPALARTVNQDQSARMQQLSLYLNYYHPCGFFGQVQSLWTSQDNWGYNPALAGDDFWQFNAYAGYRFPRRMAEVKVGLLNITGQDYRLNPLNLYYDLPRQRTLAVSLKFYF